MAVTADADDGFAVAGAMREKGNGRIPVECRGDDAAVEDTLNRSVDICRGRFDFSARLRESEREGAALTDPCCKCPSFSFKDDLLLKVRDVYGHERAQEHVATW